MWPNPQEIADFATFTEEIFNEILHFMCSAAFICSKSTTETPEQNLKYVQI